MQVEEAHLIVCLIDRGEVDRFSLEGMILFFDKLLNLQ